MAGEIPGLLVVAQAVLGGGQIPLRQSSRSSMESAVSASRWSWRVLRLKLSSSSTYAFAIAAAV